MDHDARSSRTYSGRGWGFIDTSALRNTPEFVAVPLAILGFFLVATIVALLIWRSFSALFFGNADDIYKVLLALAGAIGAPFVIWRTFVAHQQTVISRESYYTSLFTTAVEQLGATREVVGPPHRTEANLEVRLGAIYALERIAKDSERDHWTIMEVLCAYVRNEQNTGAPVTAGVEDDDPSSWSNEIPRLRVDVQAALNVIGRRPRVRIEVENARKLKLDFFGANLQRASLTGDFRNANFNGADFARASISECHLSGGNFPISNNYGVSIDDSIIDGLDLVFSDGIKFLRVNGSKIKNAQFDGVLRNCIFWKTDFSGSNFSSTELDNVRFFGCDLSDAFFEGATFKGASTIHQCKLAGANFSGADLGVLKSIDAAALATAIGDHETILHSRVARPKSWPGVVEDLVRPD